LADACKVPQLDKFYTLTKCQATQIASATRTSDGSLVVLKRIQPSIHPHEIEVGKFLASEPLRRQRENHCVEMLDVLQVPGEDDETILVLPLLRPFDNPPFETIGEIIDFTLQVFEVRSYHCSFD
jgi:hypothetical protein